MGGFISDNAGWRWLYWIQLILSTVIWVIMTFTVPETYAPTILGRRAQKKRKATGDDKFVTEQDLDLRPLGERLRVFLIRPFQLLFQEPIVLFISLYMSFQLLRAATSLLVVRIERMLSLTVWKLADMILNTPKPNVCLDYFGYTMEETVSSDTSSTSQQSTWSLGLMMDNDIG